MTKKRIPIVIFIIIDILLIAYLVLMILQMNQTSNAATYNLSEDFIGETETVAIHELALDINYENEKANKTDYDGFVFPNSHEELITDSMLATLNAKTCRRAINEIYARHGYQFTIEENIIFFNEYEWYQTMPKTSNMNSVSAKFSSIERSNVDRLQAYEQKLK